MLELSTGTRAHESSKGSAALKISLLFVFELFNMVSS